MKKILLTSFFTFIGLFVFSQTDNNQPQLSISERKDSVEVSSANSPQLQISSPTSQGTKVNQKTSENSSIPQTPVLSESTDPKTEKE